MHKFDVSKMNKLDNEQRRKTMPPLETLKKLGLDQNMTVADVGCGIGYFSIPAAEMIGSGNVVFAMDISDEMLAETNRRAGLNNINNIKTIKVDEYNLKIDRQIIDFVFMCNVLHEIVDKQKYLGEIHRILKSDGQLAIIEWKKSETNSGPAFDHRISCDEVKELFKKTGFKHINELEITENHYAIIGEKL